MTDSFGVQTRRVCGERILIANNALGGFFQLAALDCGNAAVRILSLDHFNFRFIDACDPLWLWFEKFAHCWYFNLIYDIRTNVLWSVSGYVAL